MRDAPPVRRNCSTRSASCAVFLDRHDGLAGAEAAVHFAIDAAGVGGRRLEIFFAAADLEEIEQLGVEVLGGGAGGEGPVVEAAAEARRHHGARELVVEREAQECWAGGGGQCAASRPEKTFERVRDA